MKVSDIILLAVNNLRRNTVRTVLTSLGVAVGIGSLAAMISFAQGVSGNVARSMETNDFFTGLTITSREIDFQSSTSSSRHNVSIYERNIVPLTDSTISEIRTWPEVAMVFPEVVKPANVSFNGRTISSNLKAVPLGMKDFAPFVGIRRGRFFQKDDEMSVVINKAMLEQMQIQVEGDQAKPSDGFSVLPLDSILNQELMVITKIIDSEKLSSMRAASQLPVINDTSYFKIVGIVDNNSFTAGMFSSGVFLPSETIDMIPCINLQDIFDIMDGKLGKYGKYNSVHIRVSQHSQLKAVKNRTEEMGFQVFSIGDKLDDIERIFLMLDSVLAAIGSIALLVSVLGIVNTLIMAIYERRKEIGVMKSLGATQMQIKMIFYFEAAIIGLAGGVLGILGGKIASQAASSIANSQIGRILNCDIEYFQFSWWLVVGSVLFSVLISVLASIYPARRASAIDPLDALRRE